MGRNARSQYAAVATVFSMLTFFLGVISLQYPAWTTPLSSESTTDLVLRSRRDISVGLFDRCKCSGLGITDLSILVHLSRGAACIAIVVIILHLITMVHVRSTGDPRYFMRGAYGSIGCTVCIMMSVGFYVVYHANETRTSTFVIDDRYGGAFAEAVLTGACGIITLVMYIMEQRYILLNRSQHVQSNYNTYYMVAGSIGSGLTAMLLIMSVLTPSWTEFNMPGVFRTGTGLWERCECLHIDRSEQPDWIYAVQAFCCMATTLCGIHVILMIFTRIKSLDYLIKPLAATIVGVGVLDTVAVVVFGAHLIGNNTYVGPSYFISLGSILCSFVACYMYLRECNSKKRPLDGVYVISP